MERKLKVYTAPVKKLHVPLIRIQGDWLKTVGFSIGDPVKLTVDNGRIIIEKMEIPPDEPEPIKKRRSQKRF